MRFLKTKEELNSLKEEVDNLNKKLAELSEDELEQVSGGLFPIYVSFPTGEEGSSKIVGRGKNGQPILTP